MQKTNAQKDVKTLEINKNLVDSLRTSASQGIQETLYSEMILGEDDMYRGNIYSAYYQPLDPSQQKINVGPYGFNTGAFGSDYHVQVPYNDINNYPGGQSAFENDFGIIIPNQYYPGPGTSSVYQTVSIPPLGVDAGLKNLLERIGAIYSVYKDGTFLYDITALPSGQSNVLTNSHIYPEYHKPVILDIEQQWEVYTLIYEGTAETNGVDPQTFTPNPYQMFNLYIPHVKINFELEPAFNSYLMQKMQAADLNPIDYTADFNSIMGYREIVSDFIEGKQGDPLGFKDKIVDKVKDYAKDMIVEGLVGLGFEILGLPNTEENRELAINVYQFIDDMLSIFSGGAAAAIPLICMLLTADILKAQQAAQEIKTINYAAYMVNLNYLKASIYAAVQIALEVLKTSQAFIQINEELPSGEPQWLLRDNVNNCIEKSTGNIIPSDNAVRWGSNAVYNSFNTNVNQIDDLTGDGVVDFNDIGKYGYYYAQYQTANEESIKGEPEALYYAHNCLTTFMFSLVYYANFDANVKFDSKYDELPETYSLNIWNIQDVNDPLDDTRISVFSAFSTFGFAHNAFRNLNQASTLFPAVEIPIQIVDSDGDTLTNSQEVNEFNSDPYHPDSDRDGIDDGAEYRYWADPIYMQGSTSTEMVDSDGDGFLDIEEIYYFKSNPIVADDDLDQDLLSLSLDPDPRDPDYDNDYVLDGHEIHYYGTSPTDPDSDGDTIIDGYEIFVYETLPNEPDSDFDDLDDNEEINGIIQTVQIYNGAEIITFDVECYSDPNSDDTDHDGIKDGIEVSQGTLHVYWDTDLDGLSDGWEIDNGFDPLNTIDPAFQVSITVPDSPTVLNPGIFYWSISDYYPRSIESVSILYKPPSATVANEISTSPSGSYDLISEVGYHEFTISAMNDNGMSMTYNPISIYVTPDIPDGPPIIYGSEDIISYEGVTTPNPLSWTVYDNNVIDPQLVVYLDGQAITPLNQWSSSAIVSFDCNELALNIGFHYIWLVVWEDYAGDPNSYIIDEVLVYILDSDVAHNPNNIASEIYGEYPLHGIPRTFGSTDITCEQIHIISQTVIMVGEWDQNPVNDQNPFISDTLFFTIQGSAPINFTSIVYPTLFTVSLPGDYNPEEDNYILMKWDSINNRWVYTDFLDEIDWIRGTYTFRLLEWGIFALSKYEQPKVQNPNDLSYVYNDVNIETFKLTWILSESMIIIPKCEIFFNFDWENPLGEIIDWNVGSSINFNIDSNILPPGVYTITAIFYDPIMSTYIRHDIHILVLENNLIELNTIDSVELYEHQTYTNIPLGDLEIISITTLGAVIFGGVWNENPISGSSNPFNTNNGIYFIIDTDQPDYSISLNDPEYPFILSVSLPENYDLNSDILSLMIWNETTNTWDIVDFDIEIDLLTNLAYIKINNLGIFALGVIGPVYAIGDVNMDGVIDIVDALMTAQYYVGVPQPGFHAELADVNNDGAVDIVDALLIAQYYVGLITEFPS
ncbi:MAG: dockerin type I repeat-containing protein [Candidatus Lokiarchaeota archaeon]|nr:dockerin type I repeat-containing protein [Candidatus Lokiarchaeota archaeon]